MKTTFDLPDALLDEARAEARARGTTLRDLVADGLRAVLETAPRAGNYRYQPVVFDGEQGVMPGVDLANWDAIRTLIYERGE